MLRSKLIILNQLKLLNFKKQLKLLPSFVIKLQIPIIFTKRSIQSRSKAIKINQIISILVF